jgi:hypothetical protein
MDVSNDLNKDSSEEEATEGLKESNHEAVSSDIVPQIVDDELDSNTRSCNITRTPSKLLTFEDARNQQETRK